MKSIPCLSLHTRSWTRRIAGPVLFSWLICSCIGFGAKARASDTFTVDWFSIDGAAGSMSGGVFSLDGTAGQPDAGPSTLAGGLTMIKGGFWAFDFSTGNLTPILRLQQTGSSELTLSWYPDTPGFALQQSLTLMPNSWTNVAAETANPMVLPLAGDHQFYRLIKP